MNKELTSDQITHALLVEVVHQAQLLHGSGAGVVCLTAQTADYPRGPVAMLFGFPVLFATLHQLGCLLVELLRCPAQGVKRFAPAAIPEMIMYTNFEM